MPAALTLQQPRTDTIDCDLLRQYRILLRVLRLDLMHPHLHGNKWFKLKCNLQQIQESGIETVLSFGGAYSNHLYALAAAGKQFGFNTIGMVRGELVRPLNPVLAFAEQQGMQLQAVCREQYRKWAREDGLAELRERFGPCYVLPEGGSNALAVAGCAEIAEYIDWHSRDRPRVIGLACGTGTTMAGLLRGLQRQAPQPQPSVLGIAVLKAAGYLTAEVRRWLQAEPGLSWRVLEQYHAGGYGKVDTALRQFLAEFSDYSTIPLEPVYTGKLFHGLFDLIESGEILPGSELVALHTGGVH